jgi:hypothetical protein
MNPQLGLDMTPPQQRPHAPAAIGILAGVALLAGLFAPPARAQAVPDYAAIVAAPDRSDADRETDKRRDPVKLLAFRRAPGHEGARYGRRRRLAPS